jgi:hypothetical protein
MCFSQNVDYPVEYIEMVPIGSGVKRAIPGAKKCKDPKKTKPDSLNCFRD